jgi:hypothetical protein
MWHGSVVAALPCIILTFPLACSELLFAHDVIALYDPILLGELGRLFGTDELIEVFH